MSTWLRRHLEACLDSLKRILSTPVSSLATVLILAIAVSVPLLLYSLAESFARVADKLERSNRISLFVNLPQGQDGAAAAVEDAIPELTARLLVMPEVEAVEYISSIQAFETFRESSGLGDALAMLPESSLPSILVVHPSGNLDAGSYDRLLDRFNAMAEVDSLSFDRQWQERLYAVVGIFHTASLALGLMMGLGVVLVMSNMIRTAVYSRSTEIQVLDQIGADPAFIMRPFRYYGILHGMAGALAALLLTGLCLYVLAEPVNRLAGLYGSDFRIRALSLRDSASVVALLCLLGWLSASVTTRGYIRQLRASVREM